MNDVVTDMQIDIVRGLKHLAEGGRGSVLPNEIADSFVLTCIHSRQVIPLDLARDVLERPEITAPQMRDIASRLMEIASIPIMPGETPEKGSKEDSYVAVALMALNFARQMEDPELNPEALVELNFNANGSQEGIQPTDSAQN